MNKQFGLFVLHVACAVVAVICIALGETEGSLFKTMLYAGFAIHAALCALIVAAKMYLERNADLA